MAKLYVQDVQKYTVTDPQTNEVYVFTGSESDYRHWCINHLDLSLVYNVTVNEVTQ